MLSTLEQAIAAIKAGDKQTGRWLLAKALQADPHNEKVWIWMSAVVDTDAQRRECLQRALAINPDNPIARQGLTRLDQAAASPSAAHTPFESGLQLHQGGTPAPVHAERQTLSAVQPIVPAPMEAFARDSGHRPGPVPDSPVAGQSPVDFVVREISRNRAHSDIVMALCRDMNFSWDAAEKLIRQIESEQHRRIAARRSPLLLALGVGTIVGGVLLGGFGLYELSQGVLFLSINLLVETFSMPTPVMVVTGLAMIGGGAWGMLRTVGSLNRSQP